MTPSEIDSSERSSPAPHRVVVVGGGFGGLNAAKYLRRAPVQVTLVDRRNFHLFQPLLYQVAAGELSPANIAAPLRSVLEQQRNCEILLGRVDGFDVARRRVIVDDPNSGTEIPYDTLVVAAGSRHSYFGHPEWEPFAPGLKTVEDATEIRRRIFTAFERAERELELHRPPIPLNFVIVGGGPTGVELAGAIAEISRYALKHEFRHIDPAVAKVILVEAGERVLETFPAELSTSAQQSLEHLGVTVRTKTRVTEIADDRVTMVAAGMTEQLPTRTVIWAAGVAASPLAKKLSEATGATLDRAGRIAVEKDMSLAGHPNVFVIGDMASYTHEGGQPLPGVAPVAIQQGRFVAKLINARLRGKTLPTFRYRNLGNLATIGRSAAVADFGRVRFTGLVAWVLWLFIHLMNIVNFRNRVLVFLQWAWNYLTHDHSARLITGADVRSEDSSDG
jgi:NADH:ubiquinone reductase (H+-translocating)